MAGFNKIAKEAFIERYGRDQWKNGNEPYQKSVRKAKGYWASKKGQRVLFFADYGVKYFGTVRTADFFKLTNYQLAAQLAGYIYNKRPDYYIGKYGHLLEAKDIVEDLEKPEEKEISYEITEISNSDRARLVKLLKDRVDGKTKSARALNRLAAKFNLRYCIILKELVHTDLFYKWKNGRLSSVSIPGQQARLNHRKNNGREDDNMELIADEIKNSAVEDYMTQYGDARMMSDELLAEINNEATEGRIKNHTELQKAYEEYYKIYKNWDSPEREALKNKIKEVDPVSIIIFNGSKAGINLSKIIERMACQYPITREQIIQEANEYFGDDNAYALRKVNKQEVKYFRYSVWNQYPETFEITFKPIELNDKC